MRSNWRGVDERRDLAQALVVAALGAHAELAWTVVGLGAQRRALAARQTGRARGGAPPVALAVADERALGRADASEAAVRDHQAASDEHLAVDVAAAEGLVVVVALVVAVVDPADRRVAPVDDADARRRIEEGATADEHLALAIRLLEHQPPEVGRLGVHVALGDLGAARGHLLQPLHLLDERRDVLDARFVDLIAQCDELRVVVDAGVSSCRGARGEGAQHARQGALLLGDDALHFRIRTRSAAMDVIVMLLRGHVVVPCPALLARFTE